MEKSADQKGSEEMVPKNKDDPLTNNSTANVEDADLEEMEAVNESLDELSSALDFFEQRTDSIIEQLRELLHSNREIRQQLAMEKEANAAGDAGIDKLSLEDSSEAQ